MAKILYAEDEPISRNITESILKDLGFDFKTVINGKMAVDLKNQEPFDLVLLDLQMPELDGKSAADLIRKQDPEIPLIALTADASNREELIQCGFTDILEKPLWKQKSIETLKSYLNKD